MKGGKERSGELVVARRDGAADFEMAYHTLDAISFTVDATVPTDNRFAAGLGRDDVPDTHGLQFRPDGIGIIALIRQQMLGFHFGKREDVFERGAVCRFPWCEVERERKPSGVTETVNFTGEPVPRPSKILFASPPFAPAAET